jgi:hypothetical protein
VPRGARTVRGAWPAGAAGGVNVETVMRAS